MKKSLSFNAALNVIRQSLAIVFPLITFPYTARILGSVQNGRYSFSSSIISYFMLIATFGINNYAVREGARIRDNKKDLETLLSDLFTINLLTTAVSLIILFLIVSFNTKLKGYKSLLIIQSFSIILTAVGMDWINTIYEDFLYITVRYIFIQIIALIAMFLFVKSPDDVEKYCIILVLGSYGGNLINVAYVRKYVRIRLNFHLNIRKFILSLFLLFVNSLATIIYVNSDITMLGFFTTDNNIGVYGFSSKIYNMVKYMINAVLIVAVPRLAYVLETNKQQYRKYISGITNVLVLILAPCVTGLCILSKPIIMLVGGEEYLSGSASLKILSFSLIFALIASIYTNCVLILNRLEKRCLVGTVASAILNICLNVILIPKIGISGAALTTVIAECLNMSVQAYFTSKDLDIQISINKWTLFVATLEIIAVYMSCAMSIYIFDAGLSIICSIKIISSSILGSILICAGIFILLKSKISAAINLELLKS